MNIYRQLFRRFHLKNKLSQIIIADRITLLPGDNVKTKIDCEISFITSLKQQKYKINITEHVLGLYHTSLCLISLPGDVLPNVFLSAFTIFDLSNVKFKLAVIKFNFCFFDIGCFFVNQFDDAIMVQQPSMSQQAFNSTKNQCVEAVRTETFSIDFALDIQRFQTSLICIYSREPEISSPN